MYMQYGDTKGVESPAAMGGLGILAASIALGFYLLFVKSNTVDFVVDVETECRKVTWPEWVTVRRSTGQVVVLMVFISLFIFAADLGLGYLRQAVM
jgi:preprotein translocase SecE subunit